MIKEKLVTFDPCEYLKNIYVRNLMTLFTGLVFLNMSFFLFEVSALKLNQDKTMFSNIIKLISNSCRRRRERCIWRH